MLLLRSRSAITAITFFAFVAVVIESFSFRQIGFSEAERLVLTPGMVWRVFFFSGVVLLNYTFVQERENDAMVGLLLTGVSQEKVLLSKLLVLGVTLFAVQFLVFFVHTALFEVSLISHWRELIVITGLATISFVSIGSLLASIAALSQKRDILLPILLFPLLVPLLLSVVHLTTEVLTRDGISYGEFSFILLVVFAVLSLTCSLALFGAINDSKEL